MKKFLSFLSRDKLYVIISLFLVLQILIPFIARKESKDTAGQTTLQSSDEAGKTPMRITSEEIRKREEKIKLLARDNPKLYVFLALFNMAILFFIFAGLITDMYFLRRFIRKEPIKFVLADKEQPRWGIGDIGRVSVIFVFFGYIFLVMESYIRKAVPIFANENFRMLLGTFVMNTAGIGVILYFVVKKYGQGLKEIGISLTDAARNIFYAIVGYISVIPVIFIIMLVTFFVIKVFKYEPPVQPIVQVFLEEKETGILWFSTVFAALFGPVAEEIFFRGFMYPAIKARLGVMSAFIFTSAIFSLLHAHIVGFFPIFVLGLLLAYLYEKTGTLISSMAVHVMHNLAMVAFVFTMKSAGV